eukprot:m.505926 g.505926  ORF g.505926 m.505926 type:complete len:203 (-) comp80266_c0_seq1:699-1307(-)
MACGEGSLEAQLTQALRMVRVLRSVGGCEVSFEEELRQSQLQQQAEGVVLGIDHRAVELLLAVFENVSDEELESWRLADKVAELEREGGSSFSLYGTRLGNMAWAVYNIVKPCTTSSRVPLLNLFMGLTVGTLMYGRQPCVGKMSAFHSYTWLQEPATTLGTFLQYAGRSKTYFWWDMFCQNQHDAGNVSETFNTAIRQADE